MKCCQEVQGGGGYGKDLPGTSCGLGSPRRASWRRQRPTRDGTAYEGQRWGVRGHLGAEASIAGQGSFGAGWRATGRAPGLSLKTRHSAGVSRLVNPDWAVSSPEPLAEFLNLSLALALSAKWWVISHTQLNVKYLILTGHVLSALHDRTNLVLAITQQAKVLSPFSR